MQDLRRPSSKTRGTDCLGTLGIQMGVINKLGNVRKARYFSCVRSLLPQVWNSSLRGGADKFLARPTTRCCRTELIPSLERGVCSCAELQVFSCYRSWREACQATRVISTNRDASYQVFFFLKGRARKEIRPILTDTLVEHAPSCATVKNWVA